MINKIPYDLIAKSLSGECSDSERTELEKWLNKDENHQKEFEIMKKMVYQSEIENYKPDIEAALNNIHNKLPKQLPVKKKLPGNILKIAAVFILGLGLGYIILNRNIKEMMISVTNDTAESLPMKTIMPDGSIAWLGSGSTIVYPEKFKKRERKISFTGQGYFDITSNSNHPFIIDAGTAITKVLGTEFLLEAHPMDSIVKVSVTEGRVLLKSKTETSLNELVVDVGETGIYNNLNKTLKHQESDTVNTTALKTGRLSFVNKPLHTIVEALSQQYNKHILIMAEDLDTVRLTIDFDSLEFQRALENLEFLLDVTIDNVNDIYEIRQKS